MKAIYKGQLYHVTDHDGEGVILDADPPLDVRFDNPDLIIDPTDDELRAAS